MSAAIAAPTKVGTMVHDEYAQRVNAAVAAELSDQRETRGITYKELVEDTGLSRSHLDRILKAKIAIEIGELVMICEALGVDPFVLMRNARIRVQGRR